MQEIMDDKEPLIEMEMYNTHIGLIIFHIAFQTGFCTFFKKLYKFYLW